MEERQLSDEEQELWDQLTGQLGDVGPKVLRSARRSLHTRALVSAALVLATLAAVKVPVLAVCFPLACLSLASLVEHARASGLQLRRR